MFDMFHDQHNLTIQASDKFEAKHYEGVLQGLFPNIPVMTLVDQFPDDLTVYVEAPEASGWQPGEVENVIKTFSDEMLQPSAPSGHIYCHHCGSYHWLMNWNEATKQYIFSCGDCGKEL